MHPATLAAGSEPGPGGVGVRLPDPQAVHGSRVVAQGDEHLRVQPTGKRGEGVRQRGGGHARGPDRRHRQDGLRAEQGGQQCPEGGRVGFLAT